MPQTGKPVIEKDLQKARQTTLLIDTHARHNKTEIIKEAKKIYGHENIIEVNAPGSLPNAILTALKPALEKRISFEATAGLIGSSLSLFASAASLGAADFTPELPMGSAFDHLGDLFEKAADGLRDMAADRAVGGGAALAKEVATELDDIELKLSFDAKQLIAQTILPKLDKNKTPTHGELIGLVEALLLIAATPNKKPEEEFFGKLIIISNPEQLDPLSITIVSRLLSLYKDEKKLPAKLSFLYVRDSSDQEASETVSTMLDNQRTFALRYGMYETPDSDYPNRLITPDLFVGRSKELETLKQEADSFYETSSQTPAFRTIVGEPGMGKTRLYLRHLETYKKGLSKEKAKAERYTLRLSLYNDNQLSPSSGLSSLISAFEGEAKRLGNVYRSEWFFDNAANEWAEELLREPLYKRLPFVKQIIKGAEAIGTKHDRRNSLQEQQLRLADVTGQSNSREEEFNKLDDSLDLLLRFVNKLAETKRLELFIDDLQWIDETSAEYLQTRLLGRKDLSIRLIATARRSDSASSVSAWSKKPEENQHRLALLARMGFDKDARWDASKSIDLKALDAKQVAELIDKALDEENEAFSRVLAQEVKEFLAPGNEEELSTLFTVETLNLLSDEKLYDKPNTGIFSFDTGKAAFRAKSESKLKADLEAIFNRLAEKYKDAFEGLQSQEDPAQRTRFTLSTYAVMEERLKLIEQHLGKEYAHLLVLSHLSGAPFETRLIEAYICKLAETKGENEADEKLLAPLKAQMADACKRFETQSLETLEEVYLLISDLKRPHKHLLYSHRHKLVELFMGAAFKRMLDNTAKGLSQDERIRLEYLAREVFHGVINDYILMHPISQQHEDALTSNDDTQLASLEYAWMQNLAFLHKRNPTSWAQQYVVSLINLTHSYQGSNHTSDKHRLLEEALANIQKFRNDHLIWMEINLLCVNAIAGCYVENNRAQEAINLVSAALTDIEKQYKKDPNRWNMLYALGLNTLGYLYGTTKNTETSSEHFLRALNILGDAYMKDSKSWSSSYVATLVNFTGAFCSSGPTKETIGRQRMAFKIVRELYEKEPSKHSTAFIHCLNNLAISHANTGRIGQALEYGRKAASVSETLYGKNKERWRNLYVATLKNLAVGYWNANRFREWKELNKTIGDIESGTR